MTRAWWLVLGGALLAPLVTWFPMLSMHFPDLGLPPYHPIYGMYFWWDQAFALTFLGAIAWLVGQQDRWLAAALVLAGLTFFLRGALMNVSATIAFAMGAILLLVMRATPPEWHRLIRRALVGLAAFELVYVGQQKLGYDLLWNNLWNGWAPSPTFQTIGTLGTVDGVSALFAITAPLMPLWMVPAAIFAVWQGHSLSALLALMVGLGASVWSRTTPAGQGGCNLVFRVSRALPLAVQTHLSRWAPLAVASLALSAFASMAYLKGLHTASVSSRFIMWIFGLEWMAKTSPVIGWGLGGWEPMMRQGQPHYQIAPTGEIFRQAHNEYVQWTVETGLVGLVILCGWLWTHRAMFRDPQWGGSVAALAVNAIGFFPLHVVPLALISIICVGLATPAPRLALKGTGG